MKRKPLIIDADLLVASRDYVDKQIATMRKYGTAPRLPDGGIEELVYRCAVYPQQVRNAVRRNEVKRNRRKEGR